MFSYFTKSKKQKDLFFQLDNELKKTCYDEDFNISNASEIIIVNDSYNILISNEIKIDLYHNNNLIVFLMEQISAVREAKAKI